MDKYTFPMYLTEVNCKSVNGFQFEVPDQEIYRNDIEIHIEYGQYPKDEDYTVYNVWAQFANAPIRAFLLSGLVQAKVDDENIVPNIVHDLNYNDMFYPELAHFIAHFEN